MTLRSDSSTQGSNGRDRILLAAYDLFRRFGTRAVGIDAVVAAAGVAKMTLYRHFPTKDDLILATLRRREQVWTDEWLQEEAARRGTTPAEQLLAIFEIFDEWFGDGDFDGCTFIKTLLEYDDGTHPVRQASVEHLAHMRSFIRELATVHGVDDPDSFSRQWHILMKGSIIAALEGDRHAARRARELGALLLAGSPVAA
ncbi:MAG: TetR/AcrR family transcriptional regulator [Pseudonocardiaceae bacterium]